jgi:hypothetical protein
MKKEPVDTAVETFAADLLIAVLKGTTKDKADSRYCKYQLLKELANEINKNKAVKSVQ